MKRKPDTSHLFSTAEINPDTPVLDLHGKRIYDADYAIDDFLDEQIRAEEEMVRVVCGHGSGQLYGHVKKVLEEHLAVAEVRDAMYRAGEMGSVLYVRLK